MTLLIPPHLMHLWPAWVFSSRGLISQGDNRNTPLDALPIKEKNVFVKTLNTAFCPRRDFAQRRNPEEAP